MNFIVYDLEATCWEGSPPGLVQETIEIGAFRLTPFGEVTGSYNRFIKPILHPYLSPFCLQLTNIDQELINRARSFPEVIEEFQDWIGVSEQEYLLCSWGNFDRKMFINDCKLHELDYQWAEKHINLKRQYQQLKRLNRPCGLQNALRREGFEFNGSPHRGIDDAENLVQIFNCHLDEWQY